MEMLQNKVYHKALPFKSVLMDTWYATNKLMLYIESLGKYYYCPLKRNPLVDETAGQENYKRIELLFWDEEELKSGKIIKIKKFPQAKKVKLNRSNCLDRQNGFYRYKRFISRFYGRCAKSV